MLVPLRTDAPIYHWPWVTLLVVVLNVLLFLLSAGGRNHLADAMLLEWGEGLHPSEWLTRNFMHLGFLHIVGNMIFLWGFGLLVEGKLGWWRYLLVYLGIGVISSAIEQLIMLDYAGLVPGSVGASAVIYGLLAISLVWAPKNEVTSFIWMVRRVYLFDVPIWAFASIYLVLQLLLAASAGRMGSAAIHLLGAATGGLIGLLMLTLKGVDCEGWDLLSLLSGTAGSTQTEDDDISYRSRQLVEDYGPGSGRKPDPPSSKKRRKKKPNRGLRPLTPVESESDSSPSPDLSIRRALQRIRQLIAANEPLVALRHLRKLQHYRTDFLLEQPDLRALADALYRGRHWEEALRLIEEHIERFPSDSDLWRLRFANILVDSGQRPRAALRALDQIEATDLSGQQLARLEEIRDRAKQLIADGVIEMSS